MWRGGETMTEIGNKIHELRVANAYTLSELAQLIGTCPETICRWEKGKCKPSLRMIRKMSAIFKCEPTELTQLL